jgi:hypothetical protein
VCSGLRGATGTCREGGNQVLALGNHTIYGDLRVLLPNRNPGARGYSTVSPPRENVLFVPSRNVLLTGSGWEGDRTRNSRHDAKGPRSFGRPQEGTEEADPAGAGRQGVGDFGAAGGAAAEQATHAGRWGGGPWFAWPGIESARERGNSAEDCPGAVAGGVPRFRSYPGGGIPEQKARSEDRAGGAAADHDGSGIMAVAAAEGGGGASMETAAELPRGDGAVGHQRSRLAGGARRQTVPDPHDRRRHQRAERAVCDRRFYRGEYAHGVEVCGEERPADGVLHRQGQPFSNHPQDVPASIAGGARSAATAADADRASAAGAGHRLDASAFPAGQRTGGTQLLGRRKTGW